MMNRFYFSFLITTTILITSCQEQTNQQEAPQTVIISGKIENPLEDIVRVYPDKQLKKAVTDTASVDQDGNFKMEVNVSDPDYYTFQYGHEVSAMFLSPGDSLYLTLNPEEFDESITYYGEGGIYNNYLASAYLIKEEFEKAANFKLKKEQFFNQVDSFNLAYQKKWNALLQGNANITEKFKHQQETNLLTTKLYYKVLYALKNFQTLTPELFDSIHAEIIQEKNISAIPYVDAPLYIDYLNKVIALKVLIANNYTWEYDPLKMLALNFKVILNNNLDRKLQDTLLYNNLNQVIKMIGVQGLDSLTNMFFSICANENLIIDIKETLSEFAALKEGNPSPVFSYPDINGEIVSINDLKGKYVYIDVWATWCAPCKREIPFLKELFEKYQHHNISFVSVSTDTDKEAWENMVGEKQLDGYQLFADGWKSEFITDYKINSIPRFILIDPNGNIIHANAPRPSSDQIIEVLEQLLKPTI